MAESAQVNQSQGRGEVAEESRQVYESHGRVRWCVTCNAVKRDGYRHRSDTAKKTFSNLLIFLMSC